MLNNLIGEIWIWLNASMFSSLSFKLIIFQEVTSKSHHQSFNLSFSLAPRVSFPS